MRKVIFQVPAMIALISGAGQVYGVVQYGVTNIGTLMSGANSTPYGINNSGAVVGLVQGSGLVPSGGFLYQNGTVSEIPKLQSDGVISANVTPLSISDSGLVAGYNYDYGGPGYAGFVYNPTTGQNQFIPRLTDGNNSAATSVNSSGFVVGYANTTYQSTNPSTRAITFVNGVTTPVGFLFTGTASFAISYAQATNDAGQFSGYGQVQANDGRFDAFIGTPRPDGSITFKNAGEIVIADIPGAQRSFAYGMSNSGQLVGSHVSPFPTAWEWGLLYDGYSARPLGDLGAQRVTIARDINNAGVIVGQSDISTTESHAFVYQDGVLTDLNNLLPAGSGWVLTNATGVNDSGMIIATGKLNGGTSQAVLLSLSTGTATNWSNNTGGSFEAGGNWSAGVPDMSASVSTATFGASIAQASTISISSGRTVGNLTFNSPLRYTLAGSGSLTMNVFGGASIKTTGGSHTISTPIVFQSSTNVSAVDGTTLTLNGTSLSTGPDAALYKSGAGTVELTHLRGNQLRINKGTLKILAGANNAPAGASKLKWVAVAGDESPVAALDLTNQAMVIDYGAHSPLATVTAQLAAGYSGGTWLGKGITSSSAAAAALTTTRTAIACATASELFPSLSFPATFAGQTIDDESTLILQYALAGDANLDGKVTTVDFNKLAGSFGTGNSWMSADFNYDGTVDSADFGVLAANYGRTLPTGAASLGTVVPEPGILACLVLPASTLVRVRRRR